MLALRQRGLWLLLATLFSVTAGVWLSGPLSSWMANRAANTAAESPAGSEAVYQAMLLFGDHAIEPLVRNAVDQEAEVSRPARRALGAWLDVWASQAFQDRGSTLARRAETTLGLLAESAPEMTVSGVEWAKNLAEHTLSLADRSDPIGSARMIDSADALLETLARTRPRPDPILEPSNDPAPSNEFAADESLLAEAFNDPPEDSIEPLAPPADLSPPAALSIRSIEANPIEANPIERPSTQPKDEPRTQGGATYRVAVEPAAPAISNDLNWRATRSNAPPSRPEPSQPPELRPESYQLMSDRELLAELVANAELFRRVQSGEYRSPVGSDPDLGDPDREPDPRVELMTELGGALAERGYRSLSLDHAEALLSPVEAKRLALANRLITDRSGDAPRLLLLLARDDSADVRLAAITALGSSPHRQLVEAAWSLALKDNDPRVGHLANDLRDRLR